MVATDFLGGDVKIQVFLFAVYCYTKKEQGTRLHTFVFVPCVRLLRYNYVSNFDFVHQPS
jgi:hypothetical protein